MNRRNSNEIFSPVQSGKFIKSPPPFLLLSPASVRAIHDAADMHYSYMYIRVRVPFLRM